MNKEYEYRGYRFNINVELNTKIEKRIDGNRWHTITINCMDYDNYYKKQEVEDKLLYGSIESLMKDARDYIDGKDKREYSKAEKLLMSLGFK